MTPSVRYQKQKQTKKKQLSSFHDDMHTQRVACSGTETHFPEHCSFVRKAALELQQGRKRAYTKQAGRLRANVWHER